MRTRLKVGGAIALVIALAVVVLDVLANRSSQMGFTDRNDLR